MTGNTGIAGDTCECECGCAAADIRQWMAVDIYLW